MNAANQTRFDQCDNNCSNSNIGATSSGKVAITVNMNMASMAELTSVEEREDESNFENTSFKMGDTRGKNSLIITDDTPPVKPQPFTNVTDMLNLSDSKQDRDDGQLRELDTSESIIVFGDKSEKCLKSQ